MSLDTPGFRAGNDNVIRRAAITEVNNRRWGTVAVEGKGGSDGNITADDHRVDSTAASGQDDTATAANYPVIKPHVMVMPGLVSVPQA